MTQAEILDELRKLSPAERTEIIESISEGAGQDEPLTRARGYIPGNREAAIELLRSWRNLSEDERAEQRETFEYLKRVLDEDRLSDRKLFP